MGHTIERKYHAETDENPASTYNIAKRERIDCIAEFETHCGNIIALQTQLYSYALALTRSQDAADDLLQDTLLVAMYKIDKYKPIGSFTAWTKKIMGNTFKNNARKAENQYTLFTNDEVQYTDSAPDAEELYRSKELLSMVMQLPPRQRMTMTMRIKGYKYIEIAEELGTTTGNVKSCIHQARNNIKRMMQE